MLRSIFLAATASLGLAGAAHAATQTFDLSNGGSDTQAVRTYTQGDLTLNVTAATYSYDHGTKTYAFGAETVGTQSYDYGLGVKSYWGDNHEVDGFLKNEAIVLSFSKAVRLDTLKFSYVDTNDHFGLFTGDEKTYEGFARIGNGFFSNYDFQNDYTNTVFAIGAYQSDDDWKMKKITVSYDDTPTPSPVPLPAAAWMLIAGIGGLAAMGRRKG
ncbi:VPLPA-CTERM sorting domain-containing protein [uncultured Jannaschia sp.]|uniref:VPLPA-CTERM sorting domain-containing protein n=1 Tax=uncultured Jannaschia sp. TaxID=293347 RepID=UPI0026252F3F|nr:VPLPA-CTERM sorting domain-containing protein [uncultured Jannaschia sp.]